MRFERLFKITIEHPYYTSGLSPDFDLISTPECATLLKRYRLRLQLIPGGIEMIGSPEMPVDDGIVFSFWMRMLSYEFLQFTDLDNKTISDALNGRAFLKFTNKNLIKTNFKLQPEQYEHTASEGFSVVKPAKDDYFFIRGAAISGLKNEDFTVQGLFGTQHVTVYEEKLKRIQVDTSGCTEGHNFWLRYHDIPPWPNGILGLVQIHLNQSWEKGKNFLISYFSPVAAIWKYYLAGAAEDYSITTNNNTLPTFSYHLDPPNDDVVEQLHARYPGEKIGRFIANKALPYHEQAFTGIQLRKNGSILLENLPNPSPANKGIQIILNRDNKYIFLTR